LKTEKLKERLAVVLTNLRSLESEAQTVRMAIDSAKEEIQRIEKDLNASRLTPKMTDHAIVRYIERSGMVDVKAVSETILSALEPFLEHSHTGSFPVGGGLWAVVRRKAVVTITPQKKKIKEDE